MNRCFLEKLNSEVSRKCCIFLNKILTQCSKSCFLSPFLNFYRYTVTYTLCNAMYNDISCHTVAVRLTDMLFSGFFKVAQPAEVTWRTITTTCQAILPKRNPAHFHSLSIPIFCFSIGDSTLYWKLEHIKTYSSIQRQRLDLYNPYKYMQRKDL